MTLGSQRNFDNAAITTERASSWEPVHIGQRRRFSLRSNSRYDIGMAARSARSTAAHRWQRRHRTGEPAPRAPCHRDRSADSGPRRRIGVRARAPERATARRADAQGARSVWPRPVRRRRRGLLRSVRCRLRLDSLPRRGRPSAGGAPPGNGPPTRGGPRARPCRSAAAPAGEPTRFPADQTARRGMALRRIARLPTCPAPTRRSREFPGGTPRRRPGRQKPAGRPTPSRRLPNGPAQTR
jgi:hypothetical protein